MDDLVDVIAVQIAEPHTERVMERGMTPNNAEAFIKMAVYRRGVETEFYTTRRSALIRSKREEP